MTLCRPDRRNIKAAAFQGKTAALLLSPAMEMAANSPDNIDCKQDKKISAITIVIVPVNIGEPISFHGVFWFPLFLFNHKDALFSNALQQKQEKERSRPAPSLFSCLLIVRPGRPPAGRSQPPWNGTLALFWGYNKAPPGENSGFHCLLRGELCGPLQVSLLPAAPWARPDGQSSPWGTGRKNNRMAISAAPAFTGTSGQIPRRCT